MRNIKIGIKMRDMKHDGQGNRIGQGDCIRTNQHDNVGGGIKITTENKTVKVIHDPR